MRGLALRQHLFFDGALLPKLTEESSIDMHALLAVLPLLRTPCIKNQLPFPF